MLTTADTMPLTPAETAQIHSALTKSHGLRMAAAAELGMTEQALAARVAESPELTTLWTGTHSPVTVEEAYARDKPPPVTLALDIIEEDPAEATAAIAGVSPREASIATGFHDQEQKLRKFDWEGIGVKNEKTVALMRQFEAGVGRGVLRMMDTMQGGMAFCFAQVSRQFADVAESLEIEMAKSPDDDGEDKRDENKIMLLHTRFMDLAREMQKFNKEATNAAHTRLLIADRARKLQQAGNNMRKPGWRRVDQGKGATNGKAT